MSKRLIDISFSLAGIIAVLPILPFIALLIKLDSRGPVFYPADRVGKNMENFKMYKFRTMINRPFEIGDSLSPQHDPRVTFFGRFLRRTKLNELPQLINILKGEMTFVGPRPEAPDLVELYPEKAKKIFYAKPGLIGPNDLAVFSSEICGRNEEELYPPGVNIQEYYVKQILPKKIEVDLDYLQNHSLWKDIKYIFLGAKETLTGSLSRKYIERNGSRIRLVLTDGSLAVLSYLLAYALFASKVPKEANLVECSLFLFILVVSRLLWNAYFGLYTALLKFFSYHDLLQIVKGVVCGSLCLALLILVFDSIEYSLNIAVIDTILLIILLSNLRFGIKCYLKQKKRGNKVSVKKRVLIFGAGDLGYFAFRALTSENGRLFKVVGFIDDDPCKFGKSLNGLKVLGNRHHIKVLAGLYKVEKIFLAISEEKRSVLDEIVAICREAGLRYQVFCPTKAGDLANGHSISFKKDQLSDILSFRKVHMERG